MEEKAKASSYLPHAKVTCLIVGPSSAPFVPGSAGCRSGSGCRSGGGGRTGGGTGSNTTNVVSVLDAHVRTAAGFSRLLKDKA